MLANKGSYVAAVQRAATFSGIEPCLSFHLLRLGLEHGCNSPFGAVLFIVTAIDVGQC